MDNLSVLSAYDEKLIKEVDYMNEEDIGKVFENSYSLFQEGLNNLPVYKRLAILEKLVGIMKNSTQEFAQLASLEGGKPIRDSLIEVDRAIMGIKIAIAQLETSQGEKIPMGLTQGSTGRVAFTVNNPRGLVFAISAFNHPLNLIVHQVIPAIATGCPVLIKPSLKTPLTCYKFVDALYQAGLPQPLCQVIVCKDPLTQKMCADPRISFLSFIGSAKIGSQLKRLIPSGAGCLLEHGGVAPAVVLKDADIGAAVGPLVKGSFYHAGQVCVSTQKIFVHEDILEDFCQQMVDEAQSLKVGDPLNEHTDVGPLITFFEADRVTNWVKDAETKGAKVLCGGKRLSRTCYTPTILLNPPENAFISYQEIFGPVVAIYSFKNPEDAWQRANNLPYVFQAAVFGKDYEALMEVVMKLNGTTVLINDHTAFRTDWMPFGGLKDSGLGLGGIPYAMHELTAKKMVIMKSSAFDSI